MIDNEQIQEILLSEINLDRETQIRVEVSEETVRRYYDVMIDEATRDLFPPILLFRDPDGRLWLGDGHHRVMSAIRRKFTTIRAIVRPGTKEDAIWEAAKANSRNGLPLDRADVRRGVIMLLETFPTKSTTSIAEVIGCAQSYVVKIKNEVITSDNLPDGESLKTIGKDGKSYPSRKRSSKNRTSKNNKSTKAKPQDSPSPKPSVSQNECDQAYFGEFPVSTQPSRQSATEEFGMPEEQTSVKKTEIVIFSKDDKEYQAHSCGAHFEPDPDDDYFDWLTDEQRAELRVLQATCPNRLVPQIHNFTIQNIPEHKPEPLLTCLYDLFKVGYRRKLLKGFLEMMYDKDGKESVEDVVRKFCAEKDIKIP